MKFPFEILQQCWFLAGPTASGKTALGIELAKRIDGEIISLDSMAIYQQMDIGTAKPTPAEQSQVPHHLIDVIAAHEDFSTADYMEQSRVACEEILSRKKIPIFVGGTGLYLRAVLRGVFEGPEADWDYRRQLEERARHEEANWLYSQLQSVDSVTAERLHPNDARRLIRALEIHHVTGSPASELQDEGPLPKEEQPKHVYWLHPDRDWLYERINRRVELMIGQGLEEEVRSLLALDPPIGRTARQGLGYREMIDFVEGRIATIEDAIELIQTRTRQFAKRQHTWFRNLEECRAIEFSPEATTASLLESFED
ncbi:tRNA (adenosine(37)-N6)-dimethylallyltransferase MiaA [Thalassoglobus sp.]|uniref:tRNA (adenosine(37)-N6)-dimethylallyltransferase MiaA n=1 Tax=Thalassoglobus sp. TaxID=2795869 RepID=UPI003AA8B544